MADRIPSTWFEFPRLACPTCGLRFHGQPDCRRCGTPLAPLMRIAGLALFLRNKARSSLRDGRLEHALAYAQKAQDLHNTEAGRLLLQLIEKTLDLS